MWDPNQEQCRRRAHTQDITQERTPRSCRNTNNRHLTHTQANTDEQIVVLRQTRSEDGGFISVQEHTQEQVDQWPRVLLATHKPTNRRQQLQSNALVGQPSRRSRPKHSRSCAPPAGLSAGDMCSTPSSHKHRSVPCWTRPSTTPTCRETHTLLPSHACPKPSATLCGVAAPLALCA